MKSNSKGAQKALAAANAAQRQKLTSILQTVVLGIRLVVAKQEHARRDYFNIVNAKPKRKPKGAEALAKYESMERLMRTAMDSHDAADEELKQFVEPIFMILPSLDAVTTVAERASILKIHADHLPSLNESHSSLWMIASGMEEPIEGEYHAQLFSVICEVLYAHEGELEGALEAVRPAGRHITGITGFDVIGGKLVRTWKPWEMDFTEIPF